MIVYIKSIGRYEIENLNEFIELPIIPKIRFSDWLDLNLSSIIVRKRAFYLTKQKMRGIPVYEEYIPVREIKVDL